MPTILPHTSGTLRYVPATTLGTRSIHELKLIRIQESYFTYDNTQEPSPIDHDVHFRAGVGARGEETFTPRTLIYDLKGGFGGLRKWGGLYDQQQLGNGQSVDQAKSVW